MTRGADKRGRFGRRALALVAGGLAACLLLPAGAAEAKKVGNPGSFHAEVTDGLIRIKSQVFTFDDSDPAKTVTFDGTIDAQGNVSIPTSGVHFPDQDVSGYTVHIIATNPITGTLNPLTGATSLNLRVYVKIDGVPFGGGCEIGSPSSPIVVNPLTSGTALAVPPNPQISGTPYDPSTGRGKVVNNSYSVPASDSCGIGGGTVDSTLGIPSAAGNNEAQFNLAFRNATTHAAAPITKGLNASFTTTPSSGKAPLAVTLNASGTFIPAGVRTCPQATNPNNCGYRWDYDGDGTVDETTNTSSVTHTYATPGTFQTKLTVFDADQDSDSTTRTVTATQPNPDLSINKSHSGSLIVGGPAGYTLAVQNAAGADPTLGTTTVTDTLPAGLTYSSASGTGWTCGASGQVVTCTRTAVISPGTSAPSISLNVNVGSGAFPSVTNTASVAAPGDQNSSNNSSSDGPTSVGRIDMGIAKSHDGNFNTGSVQTYHLAVGNSGTVATTGTTTVSDTLPAGISYQGYSAPAGWSCSAVGQAVSCTHAAGFAAGRQDTIDLQVVAGSLAVPSVTNTVSVSSQFDSNAANNSASDPTTVVATVDLTIDKNHTSAFRVGSSGSWTIEVANRGARTTAGTTTVHDTLPAGIVPTGASGNGWNCAVAGQDVDCTLSGSLAPSESAGLITVDANVTAAAARPTATNTATVANTGTGDDADANPANNTDSDPTTITATDVTIDKSHVGGFPLGGQGTYTLTASNAGTAPTNGTTTVTDVLPADLTYVSATGTGWNCGVSGQTVTCDRTASIGAGQTAPAITLVVNVANTDAVSTTNSASITSPDDVNSANDSDVDPTPLTAADLEITKSHSGDFRVGTGRAYTIRVRNIGSQPTTGTSTVADTLPAGLTYVGASGSGWSCGATGQAVSCVRSSSIAPGATAPTITVQVAVGTAAAPSVTNTATVSNHDDRNDANDSAFDPTTVLAPDLALIKTHQGPVQANGRATYLIAVSNQGTADTDAPATVTDTLPAGLSYAGSPSQDWDCSASSQQVSCEHPADIPSGQSAETLELRADVAPSTGSQVTNTATVAVSGDPNSANDSDDDVANVTNIDLALDKSHAGALPRGSTVAYTLKVTNGGSDPTRGNTHVSDTLPSGLSYSDASGTGWTCGVSGGVVGCDHPGTIGAGEETSIVLHADVAPSADTQIINSATVSTPGDANSANDSDSDPGAVTPGGDAAIALHPNGGFRVGSDASYRVTVRNAGAGQMAGPVVMEAQLPNGLTYKSGSGGDFSCSAAGQTVTCTDTDGLDPDERTDIGLEVGVGKAAAPSATTTASVAAPGDPVAQNNSDTAQTTVTMIDLSIALHHSGTFAVGNQSQITVNVENVGSADTVTPPKVVDQLPSGVAFSAASGSGWSCSLAGQVVTCGMNANLPTFDQNNTQANQTSLSISVTPGTTAASQTLANHATVSTRDDAEPTNDSATDLIAIPALPSTPSTPAGGGGGGGASGVAGGTATNPPSCVKKKKKKKHKRSAATAKCKKKKKKKKK